MTNAKQELKDEIDGKLVIAASIDYVRDTFELRLRLKVNHSKEDLLDFLNQLDFDYDSGFGFQELYGIIWLSNQEWLERTEYDGAENWILRTRPTIPQELSGLAPQ